MDYTFINHLKVYAPRSREELIFYALHKKSILIAVNAEKILKADDRLMHIVNQNVGYPDGVGAVLSLRQKGLRHAFKIPGCELWLDIIKHAAADKLFYFIGARQEVIEEVVRKLRVEYPKIKIAGYRNGYIDSEQDKLALIKDVVEKKPNIVFVAMGSPRQELLMDELSMQHPALYQGLGGSFDIYAGVLKRAPEWAVKYHLEWLYRLLQQPSRIRRQLHLFRFMLLLMMRRI